MSSKMIAVLFAILAILAVGASAEPRRNLGAEYKALMKRTLEEHLDSSEDLMRSGGTEDPQFGVLVQRLLQQMQDPTMAYPPKRLLQDVPAYYPKRMLGEVPAVPAYYPKRLLQDVPAYYPKRFLQDVPAYYPKRFLEEVPAYYPKRLLQDGYMGVVPVYPY